MCVEICRMIGQRLVLTTSRKEEEEKKEEERKVNPE